MPEAFHLALRFRFAESCFHLLAYLGGDRACNKSGDDRRNRKATYGAFRSKQSCAAKQPGHPAKVCGREKVSHGGHDSRDSGHVGIEAQGGKDDEDEVEEDCRIREWFVCRLDGSFRKKHERQGRYAHFNDDVRDPGGTGQIAARLYRAVYRPQHQQFIDREDGQEKAGNRERVPALVAEDECCSKDSYGEDCNDRGNDDAETEPFTLEQRLAECR